jgi:uncharacterized membrane protein
MKYVILYFIILITLFAIDFVWLKLMHNSFYKPTIGHLFAEKSNIIGIVGFYLVYPLGILFLAVVPSIESDSFVKALLSGLLLGLVAYGTYEFTNWATLKEWPLKVVIIDIVWGAFLTSVASLVSHFASKLF